MNNELKTLRRTMLVIAGCLLFSGCAVEPQRTMIGQAVPQKNFIELKRIDTIACIEKFILLEVPPLDSNQICRDTFNREY